MGSNPGNIQASGNFQVLKKKLLKSRPEDALVNTVEIVDCEDCGVWRL